MGRFTDDPPKLSEADVTRQVRDFLAAKGWRALRMQSGLLPGAKYLIRVGEPGMADFLFLRYLRPGVAAALWVELKQPNSRQSCRCARRRSGKCTKCAQDDWRAREEALGALLWRIDRIEALDASYAAQFGWMHDGQLPGQIEMFIDSAPRQNVST